VFALAGRLEHRPRKDRPQLLRHRFDTATKSNTLKTGVRIQ
jgi:hypothetical protein